MKPLVLVASALALMMTFASAGCDAQTLGGQTTGRQVSKARLSHADDAFGERVRAYLLAHPEVIGEAMEKLQADQAALKDAAASVAIRQNHAALEHDPRDGVAGDPNGLVTVVEFFDYRCPYCRAAEPQLQKLLHKRANVRLVLKEFPILDIEDQSHISENAARAALATLPQDKYLQVHRALLAKPRLDDAGVHSVLADAGVDLASDATVAASNAITDHLADNRKLARDIGVDGTPAFIVGDKLIAGAQMDQLEAAIASAGR